MTRQRIGAVLDEMLRREDVDVVLTTGGTGITARDRTYEVVSARIEKRLDGFGELFRMLSYADVGPAAMLSRACAGLARGRILVAMPGSEAAVRLAMDKLLLPGDRAHGPRGTPLMALRPDRTIVTIAEARAILAASGSPIARTETVGLHHLSGRVLACDLDATMDVPPFARAAMDGYAVIAADTDWGARGYARDPDTGRFGLHGRRAGASPRTRLLHGHRHWRAAPGRCGRGRDDRADHA